MLCCYCFRRLRHLVNQKKDNWDEYLEQSIFAINTNVHTSTKLSPFQVMFGRNCRKGADINLMKNVVMIDNFVNSNAYKHACVCPPLNISFFPMCDLTHEQTAPI